MAIRPVFLSKIFFYIAAPALLALPSPRPSRPQARLTQPMWYTQIGQWHEEKDSLTGTSFVFYDAMADGAVSGQATANLRLNHEFKGIKKFEARLSLGPANATAGMLIQDKHLTYYFFVNKKNGIDSIAVYRRLDQSTVKVLSAPATLSDTLSLLLHIGADSIRFSAGKNALSIVKLSEFSTLQWVGFECPAGSVKIFHASIVAQGDSLDKSFQETGLINLHLDRMLPRSSQTK